jgi:hypothetical protein
LVAQVCEARLVFNHCMLKVQRIIDMREKECEPFTKGTCAIIRETSVMDTDDMSIARAKGKDSQVELQLPFF